MTASVELRLYEVKAETVLATGSERVVGVHAAVVVVESLMVDGDGLVLGCRIDCLKSDESDSNSPEGFVHSNRDRCTEMR